jgi:hypothetical protein
MPTLLAGSSSLLEGGHRGAWLLAACLLTAGYCAALAVQHQQGPLLPGARTLSDLDDTTVYFFRGSYYPRNLTPYVEVSSEYPALATLSFAIPFMLGVETNPETYGLVWSYLMVAPFVLTLILIQRSRSQLGLSEWPVIIMLSPTILYFALMRFDILPTLTCAASLYLFRRRSYALAHLLLGIGVHIKWYPALLFPVFLAFHLQQEGLIEARFRGLLRSLSLRYTAIFVGTTLAIVGLTILACGWEGFLVPYRFHAGRGSQYFNAYWLALKGLDGLGWTGQTARSITNLVFLAGQFSILGVLLFRRVRSTHEVYQYSILAIVLFIAFAKVDSPQWVLWYLPLALMFVRQRATLASIIILTLLNYLVFPVAFDNLEALLAGRGWDFDSAFSWIVFVKDLALLAVVVLIFEREAAMPA